VRESNLREWLAGFALPGEAPLVIAPAATARAEVRSARVRGTSQALILGPAVYPSSV